MLLNMSLDPEEILGVSPGATLQELRKAYHEKARKHHPDQQGEGWAFRVVNQAFEALCRSRIRNHIVEEERQSTAAPSAQQAGPRPQATSSHARDEARIHPGRKDHVDDGTKLIDIDLLFIRLDMTDATDFVLTSPADRNLSCTLTLNWPSREYLELQIDPSTAQARLKTLKSAIEKIKTQTHPQGHVVQESVDRCMAWLTYPTAAAATESFRLLHQVLRAGGLGVHQQTTELVVNRPPTPRR